MSEYTRLTVRGTARRAEIAVSSDDPLGAVLPQLIDALREPGGAAARPLALLTSVGEPLDLERSAREMGLVDGSALRLLPFDSAPPPPLVIDVVDVVAEELGVRRDRWDGRARGAVTGALIALAAATASAALPLGADAGLVARLSLFGLLLAGAIGFGLGGARRPAVAFAVAAAGAAVPAAVHAAVVVAVHTAMVVGDRSGDTVTAGTAAMGTAVATVVTAVALAEAVVLMLGVGVAQRSRGALVGGALGIALPALLLLSSTCGVPPVRSAAVVGVLAVLLVGLVPWIALSASGLTGLDHRAAGQGDVRRSAALGIVDDAYRTLTGSVAALAVGATICGALLSTAGTVWSTLLAVALAAVLVLRSRAFPLRSQGLLLWGAAVTIVVCGAASALGRGGSDGGMLTAAVLVGGTAAVAGMARPRAHQRARLRALGDLLEAIVVVALLPLVVGVFGIYADLLALFGGGA
ncbi:EsaB/YukD family protein [Microbacterium sp. NPDC087665]|uniref:EsaB/YukD family protein n=1 Tax=Microbacterium sp. NPDC087665 TaxID=3364194 RepID=UPI0038106B07